MPAGRFCATTLLPLLLSLPCFGQAKSYDIYRATSPIVIDARLDESAWQQTPSVGNFHFPLFKDGVREQTVAKILWDDDNLYVSWLARDKHISAFITQRHGPVSRDDCVEIFIAPNPDKVRNYYTFEINAIATMLNRARTDWWTGPPTWEPEGVRYRASFHGESKKEESPEDDHWIVEAAIPLKNFVRDAPHTPPRDGDRWRLNLHRLGGITNAQASTWSPLPAGVQSFHTPEAFGSVRFVNSAPPQRTAETPVAATIRQKPSSVGARSTTRSARSATGRTALPVTALLRRDLDELWHHGCVFIEGYYNSKRPHSALGLSAAGSFRAGYESKP